MAPQKTGVQPKPSLLGCPSWGNLRLLPQWKGRLTFLSAQICLFWTFHTDGKPYVASGDTSSWVEQF